MTVNGRVRIVLGSGSPRRRELLERLGLRPEVVPADLDESVRPGEEPRAYVERLAIEKAEAVASVVEADVGDVVIAADTTIELDGEILGKPGDDDEARSMLRALAGREHQVHTGVAVHRGGRTEYGSSTTAVVLTELTDRQIDWYVSTGEPFDKAGAYALQGAGGMFVASVNGSVSGVIGLPLTVLAALMQRHAVDLTELALPSPPVTHAFEGRPPAGSRPAFPRSPHPA